MYRQFVLVLCVAVSCVGLLSLVPVSKTVDDRKNISSYLAGTPTKKVLGANLDQNAIPLCGESTPVVGWIDFNGDKVIPGLLPEDQNPSACFRSIQEAQAEGYVLPGQN